MKDPNSVNGGAAKPHPIRIANMLFAKNDPIENMLNATALNADMLLTSFSKRWYIIGLRSP